MFGIIWHRSKVLRILLENFDYKPAVPGWQSEIFNAITRQIRKRGGNEFDSAIAFMLVQITALEPDSNHDTIAWASRIDSICNSMMHYGKIGEQIIQEHENQENT